MTQSHRISSMILCSIVALACAAAAEGQAPAPKPPATEQRPVATTYHNTQVVDPYQWLEDWNDPAVKAWSDAQNAHARRILDALPGVERLRERITAIRTAPTVNYSRLEHRLVRSKPAGGGAGGTVRHLFFAIKSQPPKEQPLLVMLTDLNDLSTERIILDPNALDPSGGTSMDWFEPSPDGSLVAISISQGGSESGDLHVYDTATARPTDVVIPRVNYGTGGGSMAWDRDSKGFFYTRYPREGERPPEDQPFFLQVYHHTLGDDPAKDRYEIGREFPKIAEIILTTSPDGNWALANVQNGDGGEFAQWLRGPGRAPHAGKWTQLTRFNEKVVYMVFAHDSSALYCLSRQNAPKGKIMRLPLSTQAVPSIAQVQPFIPEAPDAVVDFDYWGAETIVSTPSHVLVTYLVGGPQQIRVYDNQGRNSGKPLATPEVCSVLELVPVSGGPVLFKTVTFTEPPTWWKIAGDEPSAPGTPVKIALSTTSPVDFSDIEIRRELATSNDGTKVPLTILMKKGTKLNGANPTLLNGYGGYGVSITPSFQPLDRIWFDHGGIQAIANLRGGGEFGEPWHLAGNLTNKQNVFDDFIACAQHLISSKYTNADRLAIEGGSNGGLLMGAAFTQRPELFEAVVSHVGIYDMLRVELSPNGAYNVPEFGTVNDSAQFRAMYAYSPYHKVSSLASYPPTLFLTGANDPRVDPMHSRKMTARLQAADATVLLRTSASSGHGMGTALSERIEQDVDVYAFLFDRLRMSNGE